MILWFLNKFKSLELIQRSIFYQNHRVKRFPKLKEDPNPSFHHKSLTRNLEGKDPKFAREAFSSLFRTGCGRKFQSEELRLLRENDDEKMGPDAASLCAAAKQAEKLRINGNNCFKKDRFAAAIDAYTEVFTFFQFHWLVIEICGFSENLGLCVFSVMMESFFLL